MALARMHRALLQILRLFCGCVWLFGRFIGLFCGCVCLFYRHTGVFRGYVVLLLHKYKDPLQMLGLFHGYVGLLCENVWLFANI